MLFSKVREFVCKLVSGNLSLKKKFFTTLCLGWIVFIGYLTWWNGLQSESLDKSFRWDEWIWFGVVPAIIPYLLYIIWKKDD
jgi:hypothetical protein